MSKLYDMLHLIFLLWLIGHFSCEARESKSYNLCLSDVQVVSPELEDTGFIRVGFNWNPPQTKFWCKMIFRLCKSCRIWLHLTNTHLKNNARCYPQLSSHCFPDCTYLRVVDENYNRSHTFLFQNGDKFQSISNHVSISLCNNLKRDLKFQVEFKVERKIKIINLSALSPYEKSATFKSPGFPGSYAMNGEDFMYEIIKPNYVKNVMVMFTDWIMSPGSKLIVFTTNTPMTFLGNSSRPMFASSVSFQLIFSTGAKPDIYKPVIVRGFKAVIKINENYPYHHPIPNTMCGTSVILKNYGGLLDFIPQRKTYYDCVWVILIHPDFNMVAARLRIFLADSDTDVEFREGLTSNGSLIKRVYPGQAFVSRNPNGFYIRLQGLMTFGDRFSLAYASTNFPVDTCPYRFRCRSGFCIHFTLKCDGINHCLDKSDETECYNNKDNTNSQTNSSNWSVSIIIPVVITIFIFIILCLFFIFVRRFRKISRGSGPQGRRRAASLRGNVSQQYLHNHFSMNVTLEGELDAPPSYEEVINTPSPRGNWNLAFNWSQQDLRDTPAPPPPYSEYMRENEVNIFGDNETSDLSALPPTDTGTFNNCTDLTTEEQNPISGSGSNTENIYATICETPANSLDRWMMDRSTSTSEQGIELDADNNKIAAGEQVGHEVSAEEKNPSEEDQRADLNNGCDLPSADASNSSAAFLEFENPKYNNFRQQLSLGERPFIQATRSRSVDLIPESESNSSLEILHDGQNAARNSENKNGSIPRRNSYPVVFVTNRQLNSEVFV